MPDGRRCLADADRRTMLLSPAQDWEAVSPALRYPSARPTASGTGRGWYDANPACIMLTHKKRHPHTGCLLLRACTIQSQPSLKRRPEGCPCLNANFLPRGDGNFSLPRHRPDSASHREGPRIWYRQGSCGVCRHDPGRRHNRNSPSGNATWPELQPLQSPLRDRDGQSPSRKRVLTSSPWRRRLHKYRQIPHGNRRWNKSLLPACLPQRVPAGVA